MFISTNKNTIKPLTGHTCTVPSGSVQFVTIITDTMKHSRQIITCSKDTNILEGAFIDIWRLKKIVISWLQRHLDLLYDINKLFYLLRCFYVAKNFLFLWPKMSHKWQATNIYMGQKYERILSYFIDSILRSWPVKYFRKKLA